MTNASWTLIGLAVAGGATLLLWLFRPTFGRRVGWVIVGCVGFPVAAIASIYFVGVPVMLATGLSANFLRRRQAWPYFNPAAMGVLLLGLLVWGGVSCLTAKNCNPEDPSAAVLLSLSSVAALAAPAKLGAKLSELYLTS